MRAAASVDANGWPSPTTSCAVQSLDPRRFSLAKSNDQGVLKVQGWSEVPIGKLIERFVRRLQVVD